MRRFHPNVRLRLTVWYAGTVFLLLGVASLVIFFSVRTGWESSMRKQMLQDLSTVRRFLELSPSRANNGHLESDICFLIEDSGALVHHSSAMCSTNLCKVLHELPDFMPDGFPEGNIWRSTEGREYSVRSMPVRIPLHSYVITVVQDMTPVKENLSGLAFVLVWVLGGGLVLTAGNGYWLSGRALAPLGRMADNAKKITADNLSERLPVRNPHDELGRLASVFNGTLDRLERSFRELSAFTADVSHELRTPLTVIRSVGEVALRVESDAAGYRDTIGSMLEEADRLSMLIDKLLELARADVGFMGITRCRIDLCALVRSATELLQVLAEEKGQTIDLEYRSSAFCTGDENMVRQVFINVLDNALRFTPAGGRILIRFDTAVPDRTAVDIVDEAMAIPRGEREKVFDRFHRLDPGRGRNGGGAGLGLAIARKIVDLSGGSIRFVDHPGAGNCCRIELPVSYG